MTKDSGEAIRLNDGEVSLVALPLAVEAGEAVRRLPNSSGRPTIHHYAHKLSTSQYSPAQLIGKKETRYFRARSVVPVSGSLCRGESVI